MDDVVIRAIVEDKLSKNNENVAALSLVEEPVSIIDLNSSVDMQLVTYNTGLYTIKIKGAEVLLFVDADYMHNYCVEQINDRHNTDAVYLTKFNKIINLDKQIIFSGLIVKEILYDSYLLEIINQKLVSNEGNSLVVFPGKSFNDYLTVFVSDEKPAYEDEINVTIIEK